MYITICEIDRQSRFDAWDRVLRAGALGWPWGVGGGFRMGTHEHLWLIHVNVWQKPLEYFKVISLQLNFKKKVKSLSRVQLFGTPWTIVHQAPLGKNTGVGCYFLLQGIFPTQGFEPRSPTLQADALTSEPPRKPIRFDRHQIALENCCKSSSVFLSCCSFLVVDQ